MRIKTIGVSNYRNIAFARLDLDADRVFLLGRNGQGKTNLLEAVGCVTSLRAFRTRENETMIGPQGDCAEIAYEVDHEDWGESSAQLRIKRRSKGVMLDGESVKRASDFVGRFPTVTLSSEDLSIVRGSPGGRRRFIDTFLCGIDRGYYVALQRYQKIVQERNALLKRSAGAELIRPFEKQLAAPALELISKRAAALQELGALATRYYDKLSGSAEPIGVEYKANVTPASAEDYAALLDKHRKRDQVLQSTGKGPHRDDFDLTVDGKAAADFASDGQQRSIALALAFAVLEAWRERYGVCPVLLVDDVLGELDPERRARFWSALDPSIQLVATGTELPKGVGEVDWLVYAVEGGVFQRQAGG